MLLSGKVNLRFRPACRSGEGVASGSRSRRDGWAGRIVLAAEPDAGGAGAAAALGMGGAPASSAGGRRRCRNPSGRFCSRASLLPRAAVC